MNALFAVNFSTAAVATALWEAQGQPVGGTCAAQAVLVDVGAALDPAQSPNRTAWAQSALLWSAVRGQNASAVVQLRKFVNRAPWDKAAAVDGPLAEGDAGAAYVTGALGWTFDFGAQRVSAPAVRFAADGQPSSEQLGRVGSAALTALDRMYSYASGA
jgi:hypothetical protein